MFEYREYFELLTFLSCWNVAAEGGSEIMNEIDCVPSGDALMRQLQKFKIFEVEEMFNKVFEKQFRKQVNKKKKAVVIVDIHEQETYRSYGFSSRSTFCPVCDNSTIQPYL